MLDGRDRTQILEWMESVAPYYVDDWDPEGEDAGTVTFEIFADMAESVVERLDRVPEKQRAAFLNALEFDAQPPRAARLPVTFTVDEGVEQNITVPAGTTVTASGTDERDEQRFETVGDRPFEATPAALTDVYGVDPGTDRIVDHGAVLSDDEPVELFTGENEQTHRLYLAHDDLLNLNPGGNVEVEIPTNAPPELFREYLTWEYYGENPAGEEGWHELEVATDDGRGVGSVVGGASGGASGSTSSADAASSTGGDAESTAPQRADGGTETTARSPTRRAGPTGVAAASATQRTEAFLDRLADLFAAEGVQRAPDESGTELLVRSLVDDVRKGRFAAVGETDTSPTLPPNLVDTAAVPSELETVVRRRLARLQTQLSDDEAGYGTDLHPVTLGVTVPGEITEREIEGIESRWIRCRLPDGELSHDLFDVLAETARVSVGSGEASAGDALPLDEAVADDVPLAVDGDGSVRLMGENPTEASTFAFACEEAFTKPGASVTLHFESDERVDRPDNEAEPELAWEYWNGDGWRRLSVEDTTENLQRDGTVSFGVPGDVAPTTILGHERHWLRARLVSGNYGEMRIAEAGDEYQRVTDHVSPPEYTEIGVDYVQSAVRFEHQLTQNNRTFADVSRATETFRPFEGPPGENQAVYFGFDGPLRNGPINAYLALAGAAYPHDFEPWTDVEYCVDPEAGEWERLDSRDDTEDLTERGVLSFALPEETTAFELFGRERHWIRVRVTGDEFARSDRTLFVESADEERTSLRELSTETIAERERAERSRTPPVVEGIHPNTVWAENVESVDGEIVGSSGGTANQTFRVAKTPVLAATVWVDERDALSQRERRRLAGRDDVTVDRETDDDDATVAFWVQWESVSDFLRSDADDRHYTLNRSTGEITFGDGQQGAIPPAGENNVRVTYRTGGGEDGNVAVGAVDGLEDDLSFVEGVTNPVGGETGESEESVVEFVERAPKRLRDRDKPITRDGFERVAASAATEIGKVKCSGGADETGAPGHVTLLVVPDVDQRRPVPSEELLDQVETEMQERAPEAVVGRDRNLTVRAPNYLSVSVTATVETDGSQSVTRVQEATKEALRSFTHPLHGGPEGDGWEIGTAPPPTVFTNRLERVPSVNRVTAITVDYEETDNGVTLAGGADAPIVPPDVLVCSGTHTIDVEIGDG